MTRLLVRGKALMGLPFTQERRQCALRFVSSDHLLLDQRQAPKLWKEGAAVVYPNMITDQEASAISDEILGHRMRRRRYEKGHWDSVITGYREIELLDLHQIMNGTEHSEKLPHQDSLQLATIAVTLARLRRHLEEHHETTNHWLPCHAIDLAKNGELHAHVDSVRFSGHIVAGLSLLSPAIMRLKPSEDGKNHERDESDNKNDNGNDSENSKSQQDDGFVDLYLPPNSLYVLSGVGRYQTSHELLPDGSKFGDVVVNREQRLSIIFRDAKEDDI